MGTDHSSSKRAQLSWVPAIPPKHSTYRLSDNEKSQRVPIIWYKDYIEIIAKSSSLKAHEMKCVDCHRNYAHRPMVIRCLHRGQFWGQITSKLAVQKTVENLHDCYNFAFVFYGHNFAVKDSRLTLQRGQFLGINKTGNETIKRCLQSYVQTDFIDKQVCYAMSIWQPTLESAVCFF